MQTSASPPRPGSRPSGRGAGHDDSRGARSAPSGARRVRARPQGGRQAVGSGRAQARTRATSPRADNRWLRTPKLRGPPARGGVLFTKAPARDAKVGGEGGAAERRHGPASSRPGSGSTRSACRFRAPSTTRDQTRRCPPSRSRALSAGGRTRSRGCRSLAPRAWTLGSEARIGVESVAVSPVRRWSGGGGSHGGSEAPRRRW